MLGGCAAVEQAAKNAGHDVAVPFTPGRRDASQEQTDADSFAVLEPTVDGFRNYSRPGEALPLEHGLLERAYMLTLTAPEMTVLIGGMRALDANFGQSQHGVLTDRPDALSNDFFVNLLDMSTEWFASDSAQNLYEGRDRGTGEAQVDRHVGRSRVRLELRAAGAGGGLRVRRRRREVRARLRRRLGQGHEPRSLRSLLTGPARTRVYLARHGQTAYNHEGRFQGQLPVPLDDTGARRRPNWPSGRRRTTSPRCGPARCCARTKRPPSSPSASASSRARTRA